MTAVPMQLAERASPKENALGALILLTGRIFGQRRRTKVFTSGVIMAKARVVYERVSGY